MRIELFDFKGREIRKCHRLYLEITAIQSQLDSAKQLSDPASVQDLERRRREARAYLFLHGYDPDSEPELLRDWSEGSVRVA